MKVYDPDREEPILYRAGDYIRFYPVTAEDFDRIAAENNSMIEMREETT